MVSRFPCPCCGHLTLSQGPGDYETCPVCFWEDDEGGLRYPMKPGGPNGMSLVDAQRAYLRTGAITQARSSISRSEPRRPRPDEPVEMGWRTFDPARDWTDPRLAGDTWPVNPEVLYYWRPTYWNGDQHRLPEARGRHDDDGFARYLKQEVPQLAEAAAESERRWGRVSAFAVCRHAARLVIAAYQRGDEELGRSIVTALLPGLDEDSDTYAPNCVLVSFLGNDTWYEPWAQPFVDRWPAPIRDDLRRRQAHQRAIK